MINEDNKAFYHSFLIDLDLAIQVQQEGASGAKGMTGTRAFMSINVLLGERHSFMDDLESFFWVLFWICIHYNGPDDSRVVDLFDEWNYMNAKELAATKLGRVADEDIFIAGAKEHFTQYYQILIPCVNELRKVVFPNGGRWKREDKGLYTRMRDILREASKDAQVADV